MITKVTDTVLDIEERPPGSPPNPRVSVADMVDGSTTTTATTLAQIQANPTRIPNYETLENLLKIFVPAGTVTPYAGASAPLGWLLCDGSSFSAGTYPELAVALGGTTLPDLRGCVVAGLDNMGGSSANRITNPQADTLGGFYGEEEITLDLAEMPLHDHNVGASHNLTIGSSGSHTHTGGSTDFAGNHRHSNGAQYNGSAEGGGGDCEMCPSNTGFAGNHQHTFTVGSGGSNHSHPISGGISVTESTRGNNEAHDNIQPTRFLNYIIKAH